MSGRRGVEPSAIPSGKIPERRKIYVIFEGEVTEPSYFEHYSKTIGRNCYFEINPIPKIGIDLRQTDRVDMIDIAKGYMTYVTTGKCDSYYFVTIIMNDYYRSLNNDEKNKLLKSSSRIRRAVIRELETKGHIKDGLVIDYKTGLEEVIKILRNSKYISADDYYFQNTDQFEDSQLKTYNPPYDRVFIVFDRDYSRNEPKLRTKKDYDSYIDKCKEYGYDALVSTPMFEFWLLIHHRNIDYLDYDYDIIFKDKVEKTLEKLEGTYGKRIPFERFKKYYLENFEFAVEASYNKLLTTDLYKLENNIGSNVGVMLKSLQNK